MVNNFKGIFCPICKDWILNPKEVITENIEIVVIEHYEVFHTAKEIEKFSK